jgi:hypothetical protein
MVFVTSLAAVLLLVPVTVLSVEVAYALRRIGVSLPTGG